MKRIPKHKLQERYEEKRKENLREIFPAQMSLERVPLFTPSSTQQLESQRKVIEHADLSADIRCPYGLPMTYDLDLYRAFQKILFEHLSNGGDLDKDVKVPTKRLLRYAGKAKGAGKEGRGSVQAVKTWFDRMSSVSIKATFYEGKDRSPTTIRGGVFDAIVSPGEIHGDLDSVADTNYVWIGHILKQDLLENNVRFFDLDFHRSLKKAIGKSLYPLLATGWYASKGKVYKKRYSHLSDLFLFTSYTALSRVTQQLKPSLEELKTLGFVETWRIEPSKRYAGDFILCCTPGERYHAFRQSVKERREIAQAIKKSMKQGGVKTHLEPKDMALLEEILLFNKDEYSRAGYQKVLQTYPEHLVRAALSETKLAASQKQITKTRGAYFMDTLKRLDAYRKN